LWCVLWFGLGWFWVEEGVFFWWFCGFLGWVVVFGECELAWCLGGFWCWLVWLSVEEWCSGGVFGWFLVGVGEGVWLFLCLGGLWWCVFWFWVDEGMFFWL
jgi:hypothetical protein